MGAREEIFAGIILGFFVMLLACCVLSFVSSAALMKSVNMRCICDVSACC